MLTVFYLVGLTIACFLLFLILLKKNKTKPDTILLSWLCLLALHLFLFFLQYKKISYEYPHLLGLMLPMPLLHGVLLYFYAQELTGISVFRYTSLLHFIPFLFLTTLAIPFYLLPAADKIYVFENEGKGFEWYSIIQLSLILVSGLCYSVATFFTLQKYRAKILNSFSNNEHKMLRWLHYLTLGLGLIWIVSALADETIIFGGVVLLILFIGFFGINQVPVFYPDVPPVVQEIPYTNTKPTEAEKYARTGLKEEEIPEVMRLLETLMKTKKPFRNGELTLNDLATQLNIPAHQLSQVINVMSGNTFYHYVNTYRIQEFLEMAFLPENKRFTFLALAYDCGFNSKTTFNKYFKLQTGKTPSEYIAGKS